MSRSTRSLCVTAPDGPCPDAVLAHKGLRAPFFHHDWLFLLHGVASQSVVKVSTFSDHDQIADRDKRIRATGAQVIAGVL